MKRLPPIQARTANPLLDFTEGGEGGWSEVCETVTCISDVQFGILCQNVALILLMDFSLDLQNIFLFFNCHSETIPIPNALRVNILKFVKTLTFVKT